jgi:hypothetical protein
MARVRLSAFSEPHGSELKSSMDDKFFFFVIIFWENRPNHGIDKPFALGMNGNAERPMEKALREAT